MVGLLWFACMINLSSCNKKDAGTAFPQPTDSLEHINRWILDSMYYYYYWNSPLTSVNSLSGKPADFFNRLLNASDRFSWISDGQTTGPSKNSFEYYGFHYWLINLPAYATDKMLGIISLAAPESAADRAALTRGVYFSKVNNQPIQNSNIESIKSALQSGNSLKLTLIKDSSGVWKEYKTVTLTPSYFEERPVYTTMVYEKNGKKTGYLFYNAFNETFDADLLNAFSKLRTNSISELILDLRYNPGGSVASASKLCALASQVNKTDVFAAYKGNNHLKEVSQSFEKAINASANNIGKNFSDLQANRVTLQRVFVLTTRHTASAAEMVINNLKPYLQVIVIGEATTGKDMAGALIRDLRQPKKVSWFIQPLVFKLYNAQNKGDYEAGIIPDHQIKEYESLPLPGPGDVGDPLIKKALELIYSDNLVNSETLRKTTTSFRISAESVLYNSMQQRNSDPVIVSLPLQ